MKTSETASKTGNLGCWNGKMPQAYDILWLLPQQRGEHWPDSLHADGWQMISY